jgi:hypothetical protein
MYIYYSIFLSFQLSRYETCSDRDKRREVTEIRILILLDSNFQTFYILYTPSNHRWVDSIKMDHREIGWDGVDWVNLAQDMDQWRAFVNMVMNLWVP